MTWKTGCGVLAAAALLIAFMGDTSYEQRQNSARESVLTPVGAMKMGGRRNQTTLTYCPGGCGWTVQYSCPGQPHGSKGLAGDDGSEGYRCCCGAAQPWKAAARPQPTSIAAEHRPGDRESEGCLPQARDQALRDVLHHLGGLPPRRPLQLLLPPEQRVELVGPRLRCGRIGWLSKFPAAAAGCLALVRAQPAASCSHTYFVYADLGDRNCACTPPRSNCGDLGSKDVVAAAVASLYRATTSSGGLDAGEVGSDAPPTLGNRGTPRASAGASATGSAPSGLCLWEAPSMTAVRSFPDVLVLDWLQNVQRRNKLVMIAGLTGKARVTPNGSASASAFASPPPPESPPPESPPPPPPPRCRFAIVDQFMNEEPSMPSCALAAAIENHRRYANVHGYAYYHTTTSDPEHRTRHNTFAVDAQFHKLRRVRELLEYHEWVLQVDIDAIFVDLAASMEDIVSTWAGHTHRSIDLLYSGNAIVISSGVLLFRRSSWTHALLAEATQLGQVLGTQTDPEWRDPGQRCRFAGCDSPGGVFFGDNWALAVLLAGCSSTSPPAALADCWRRADGGNGNATFTAAIHAGDQAAADGALSVDAAMHARLLPHVMLQSDQASEASFVLHYPGDRHWHDRLLWRLTPADQLAQFERRGAYTYPKTYAIRTALRATHCGDRWLDCFPAVLSLGKPRNGSGLVLCQEDEGEKMLHPTLVGARSVTTSMPEPRSVVSPVWNNYEWLAGRLNQLHAQGTGPGGESLEVWLKDWVVTKPGPAVSDEAIKRSGAAPAVDCSAVRYSGVLTGQRRAAPRTVVDFVPVGIDLDVVEIRLLETFEAVDVFVLYEAAMTQTARPKPLYLLESMSATTRWARFESKMLHLVGTRERLAGAINATKGHHAKASDAVAWALEYSMRTVPLQLLRESEHRLARVVLAAGPDAVALQNDGDELPSLATLVHLKHCETGMPPPFSLPATQYKANLWTTVRHNDMEWIAGRWAAAGIPLPSPAYTQYLWRPGPTVSLLSAVLEAGTTGVGRSGDDKNSWPDFGPGAAIHLSSDSDPVSAILKTDAVIEGTATLLDALVDVAARGEMTPETIRSILADDFCATQRFVHMANTLTPAHLAALRVELPWPLRELDTQYPCLILEGTGGSCRTAPVCTPGPTRSGMLRAPGGASD